MQGKSCSAGSSLIRNRFQNRDFDQGPVFRGGIRGGRLVA